MEPRYVTVSALNKYLKAKFIEDQQLSNIYLKGEISNFKYHSSGHCYFTLKDSSSRINAVLFSSQARKITFAIEDGMHVLVEGSVSIYEATGQYQLYVRSIILDGIGQLYVQFEQLKKKLEMMGYFDHLHKKEIKKFPKKIGIITGANTAALKDIVKVISNRFPFVEIYLFPTLVQGKTAANDIVKSIKKADQSKLDTILLARGGGSLEDLWPFNQEIVAQAVYDATTPIISAIGHESDVVITDYVADVRAATPTAGASLIVPDYKEVILLITHYKKQMSQIINLRLRNEKTRLQPITNSYYYKNPKALYQEEFLRLSILNDSLQQLFHKLVSNQKQKIDKFDTYLSNHSNQLIIKKQNQIQIINQKLQFDFQIFFKLKQNQYNNIKERLHAYSPLGILKRGFTYITKDDKMIVSAKELHQGDAIEVSFIDGKRKATIND